MLTHTGTLHLSHQRPIGTTARDGSFTLTLLAIDRAAAWPQPYLLPWHGPQARAFWAMHAAELTPRAELQVELPKSTKRRQVSTNKQQPSRVFAGLSAIN